ncbi:guanine nucleotide binding protein, alpha subunit [Crucibulum laeve]|uniref:Guanine nucleotide binding protein, alpha subunit n=1 Tax=Crucibulum laeve TaxID=68775 RepID=A0A5C3M7X0_9AGAR|nr:guanine nucleotide binding protein, alpha subunit [Crucibulum laeve]
MPVPSGPDPLDEALRPPADETPEQRAVRLEREEGARRVSQAIDASIKAERQARRKKRIVRLLLLGQSESGKSTTLRQFQRLYTPTAFREERILWRAVIQLNIVRSIRTILDAISYPPTQSPHTSPYSSPRSRARSISRPQREERNGGGEYIDAIGSSNGNEYYNSPPRHGRQNSHEYPYEPDVDSDGEYPQSVHPGSSSPRSYHQHSHSHSQSQNYHQSSNSFNYPMSTSPPSNPSSTTLASSSPYPYPNPNTYPHPYPSQQANPINSPAFEALKARLLPLRHVEALLIAKLVPPNEDEATHLPNIHGNGNGNGGGNGSYGGQGNGRGAPEIFVRPGPGWKGALARARVGYPTFGGESSDGSVRPTSAGTTGLETQDECQEVLNQCRRVMIQLWNDEGIREVLRRRKIRVEEFPGFFLNDLERVTSLRYMPTDDDVLKARLKTVGVSEYKFEMEVSAGRDSGTEWRIVDVGGSRSQVTTWVPFFDDVDAIIFLAPISGFDQVLAEDRTVNRLEDSVLLWKAVCSNKLLANVDLVLFLNKCDILEAKLNSGIRLAKYVRSYGDRENDLDSVSKYLRSKFSAIHREYSPNPRKFYAFCTSVTDTATTAGIIASVRDMVIRQHLKQSKLL